MGRKKQTDWEDEYAVPDEAESVVEDDQLTFEGKKKKKKGGKATEGSSNVADESSSVVTDAKETVSDEEEKLDLSGKKKKKKGSSKADESPLPESVSDEEKLDLTGKKKKKKKNDGEKTTASVANEEEKLEVKKDDEHFDVDNVEVHASNAGGKKKQKKKDKVIPDDEYGIEITPMDNSKVEQLPPEEKLDFGKKKKKKDKVIPDEEYDIEATPVEDKVTPTAEQATAESRLDLGGKKKKKKDSAFPDDEYTVSEEVQKVEQPADLELGSKKKKKKDKTIPDEEYDIDAIAAAVETKVPVKVAVPDKKESLEERSEGEEQLDLSSKKKKKKKKGSSTVAEGQPETSPKVEEVIPAPPTSIQGAVPDTQKEAAVPDAEEPVESAAAKKKKKKKEKEKKEEKASTEASKPEKKVPKHVREMQELLARRKEEEERRKREEEEKARKEEEERRRQEELERQREEAKQRRKQREKEKLAEKKRNGLLLTQKQKVEAKRLAIVRDQFLAGQNLPTDETSASPSIKKPKYESKKKQRGPVSGQQGDTLEDGDAKDDAEYVKDDDEPVKEGVSAEAAAVDVEGELQGEDDEDDEGDDDDDDDWEAKSWDDKKLPVLKPAFADEDEEEAKVPEALSPKPSLPKPSSPKEETKVVPEQTPEATNNLRSPICCILGHVDTGKTKLLDCIRRTNVQEGEAGGITQQIGATYFPVENIRERTKELKADATLRVPGLLVIDTPGHESFTNLRSRGSGLCDIAILVIDIVHGLEPQTIESLNLLKMRKTPFVVALNKVDRLYDWKPRNNSPIRLSLKGQPSHTKGEFDTRVKQIIAQIMERGVNAELYWQNKDMKSYANIVPTSAVTGEGIPDLLLVLVQLTQRRLEQKLVYSNVIQCTVLEVKVVEGLGTTIDVVLVNGILHEGEQIVVCGMQGPIVTSIRALLTPHPMKELRVKGSYLHHKELKAAQGIKITAQGLEHAVAGTQLYVVGPEDDLEAVKEEAMEDMKSVMGRLDKSGEGVCVQASTLGSLEALLEFLKSPDVSIPVSGISIGPVHRRDVMRASVMLERKKEYATILAFDVKVTPEARELAEELGVRVFTADIIYHLFDQFTAYLQNLKEERKKDSAEEAIFPCIVRIIPECIFNKKDPIVLGVEVLEGSAKVGTPICVPGKDGNFIELGRIASLEINHKVVDFAKKGESVAMKIVGDDNQKMFGRHFDASDMLVSHITRKSIDVLKENYRNDVSPEDWKLIVKLKKIFQIQ